MNIPSNFIDWVERDIIGRAANKIGDKRYDSLELIRKYTACNGDHIEIGSLFGASAIVAALTKIVGGYNGMIFCIDPLDGYYKKYAPRDDMVDTQSGIPVTPQTFFANLDKFDVAQRICLIRSYSNRVQLPDMQFITAYIDGDHRGDMPWRDWLMLKDRVIWHIMFDNYDEHHPDVVSACKKAESDSHWEFCEHSGITYILQRTVDGLRELCVQPS